MTQVPDNPRHSQRVAVVLTVLVGATATAVAYFGTRESTRSPAPPTASSPGTGRSVEAVILPNDEPELPSGPNQRTFQTSCSICHSTRLVMTQPPFAQKQWAETVHKMVKTYGAPIAPDAEGQVVEYLTAVRGE